LAVLGGVVTWAVVYVLIFRDLPEIYALDDYRPNLITRITAKDGTVIGSFARERRIVVPIEEVPGYLVQAFISAEDDNFYSHEGLDYPSIMRAAWANLKAGGVRQGGSTITQQVAKTFLLTSERKLVRKLRDMVLARRIEQHLQKNQILYLYLNQIYLGSGAYGVEAAAQTYFKKSVSELSLAEAALIAGLVPAPSRYSPRQSMELAKQRQRFVLRRMADEQFITPEEHDAALAEEIVLAERPHSDQPAAVAYFLEEVRRYLVTRYGEDRVLTGGLHVRTTMDLEAQLGAYNALRDGLRDHDRRTGYRGPVRVLAEEEWELALEELETANAEVREFPGSVIQGLIVALDDKAERIDLRLGLERTTTLGLKDVVWARRPDPEWDGAIPRIKKVSQALSPGQIVLLERTGEAVPEGAEPDPETGELPITPVYTLYQEPESEGALFSMNIETGEVQAISGGYSFSRSQFDRATQMRRQPGSAFKPIVYATAITRGYTPASIVYDTPIVYRDNETGFTWKPGNYSDKFYGPIPLRHALAKSRNVATVKILRDIGIAPVIEMARALGIERDLQPNLSLGLGASEVTLAELVRAYATFASGGRRVEPVFLLEVRDRDGELLEENIQLLDALLLSPKDANREIDLEDEDVVEQIVADIRSEVDRADDPDAPPPGYGLDPITAYLMVDMLQAVVQEGTGWRARALGRATGGKTGTTNDLKDAWYIGFSPEVVAGVWVGYDTARPLGKNETGSRAASPIFVDYATEVMAAHPKRNFPVPEGIVFARIDRKSGKIACPGDEKAIFQPFREGTVPSEQASCYSGNGGGHAFPPRID
jgi:penicillin-binding protein 1A